MKLLPKLSEIRKLRLKLGLTQTKLSRLSGVSQSLIAKLERGYVVPNYDTFNKLYTTLKDLEFKDELKAKNLMTKKVISVKPNNKGVNVVNLFKENNISQCPVIDEGRLIGSITEESLINNLDKINDSSVNELMNEPFPIVNPETRSSIISSLLKEYKAVIVSDKGRITGIISKADLLRSLS